MEKWPRASLAIFWLQLSWVSSEDKVIQSPPSLVAHEGDNSTLSCSYKVTNFQSLFWFKQEEKTPTFLLRLISSGTEKSGRLKGTLDKKELLSTLHITTTQLGDSATYLCAVEAINRLIFGSGTILRVKPYVKEPDPAVYQLGGSKSNQISVCLFTDFDSETNVQEPQGPAVISLNSTVLDMKVMNSKSNAALAWGNSTDFKCNGTFNEKFFSSSDFSCDATLIAKNFETDMNLNFHNLIVIGLRILLLKVAGFNLFMTLRLWSR